MTQAVGAGGNRYCTAAAEEHIRNLLVEAVAGIHRVEAVGIHRVVAVGIHRVEAVGSHLRVVAGNHMDWGAELRVDPTHQVAAGVVAAGVAAAVVVAAAGVVGLSVVEGVGVLMGAAVVLWLAGWQMNAANLSLVLLSLLFWQKQNH
jgi:hypothetical protein